MMVGLGWNGCEEVVGDFVVVDFVGVQYGVFLWLFGVVGIVGQGLGFQCQVGVGGVWVVLVVGCLGQEFVGVELQVWGGVVQFECQCVIV